MYGPCAPAFPPAVRSALALRDRPAPKERELGAIVWPCQAGQAAPAVAIVYFVVLVGVLVFVHELGHFAWAKFFGVKVLRFSLGFGPAIAGVRRGETEYVIAAFPLGGYVRMVGDTPGETVSAADEARSLGGQALWKRIVIVLAGPLMNLSFPLVLYFVVHLGQSELPPPVIGVVLPDHAADGQLRAGDRVLSIEGEEITTWYELSGYIEPSAGVPLDFVVDRDGERIEVTVTPALAQEERPLDLTRSIGRVGIQSAHPLAVVGIASEASPAGTAGLRTFDRIVAAAQQPVERWLDLVRILARLREEERGGLREVRVEEFLGLVLRREPAGDSGGEPDERGGGEHQRDEPALEGGPHGGSRGMR